MSLTQYGLCTGFENREESIKCSSPLNLKAAYNKPLGTCKTDKANYIITQISLDFWHLGIKGFDLFDLKVTKTSIHYVKI